jgi:hypothetical protein
MGKNREGSVKKIKAILAPNIATSLYSGPFIPTEITTVNICNAATRAITQVTQGVKSSSPTQASNHPINFIQSTVSLMMNRLSHGFIYLLHSLGLRNICHEVSKKAIARLMRKIITPTIIFLWYTKNYRVWIRML